MSGVLLSLSFLSLSACFGLCSFLGLYFEKNQRAKLEVTKMFVTGQGLNILRGKIYQAVRDRDGQIIRQEARRQLENGADGLDINLGSWGRCSSTLPWMVEQVRAVSDCPLFLPPCPDGLAAGLKTAGSGSFINCVIADKERLKSMFSAADCLDASLVVLLTRRGYLPASLDEMCMVAEEVLELAEKQGFSTDRLILDPVLRPRIGCFSDGPTAIFPDISLFMEALFLIGKLREKKVKTIVGLSNITCGLPTMMHNRLQLQVLNMLRLASLDYVIMNTEHEELVEVAKAEDRNGGTEGFFIDSSSTYLPDIMGAGGG